MFFLALEFAVFFLPLGQFSVQTLPERSPALAFFPTACLEQLILTSFLGMSGPCLAPGKVAAPSLCSQGGHPPSASPSIRSRRAHPAQSLLSPGS